MKNKNVWIAALVGVILIIGGVSAFSGNSLLKKGTIGTLITNETSCRVNGATCTCANAAFSCVYTAPALSIDNVSANPEAFNPDVANAKTEIKFSLNRRAYITVSISRSGRPVRTIINNIPFDAARDISVEWDGTANGTKVAAGTYTYTVSANAQSVGRDILNIRAVTGNIRVDRTSHINATPIVSPYTFNPDTQTATVIFGLSRPGYIWVTIKSLSGSPVKNLRTGQQVAAGTQSVVWDGTDANGRKVGNGSYRVAISVSDTASGNSPEANQDTLVTVARNCEGYSLDECRQNSATCEVYNTGSVLDGLSGNSATLRCRNKTVPPPVTTNPTPATPVACESFTVTTRDGDSLGLGSKNYVLSVTPSTYTGNFTWQLSSGAGYVTPEPNTRSATAYPTQYSIGGFNDLATLTITSADSRCTKMIYARTGNAVAGTGPAPQTTIGIDNLGLSQNSFGAGNQNVNIAINFTLNIAGTVTASIKDSNGTVVKQLATNQAMSAGSNRLSWNGRYANGGSVTPGTYKFVIEARGNNSVHTGQRDITVTPSTGYDVPVGNFDIYQGGFGFGRIR